MSWYNSISSNCIIVLPMVILGMIYVLTQHTNDAEQIILFQLVYHVVNICLLLFLCRIVNLTHIGGVKGGSRHLGSQWLDDEKHICLSGGKDLKVAGFICYLGPGTLSYRLSLVRKLSLLCKSIMNFFKNILDKYKYRSPFMEIASKSEILALR